MTVKELPTVGIGIIAIVAAPAMQTIATLVEHIILSSGELDGTSDAAMQEISLQNRGLRS